MSCKAVRAFVDPNYDYYRLTKDFVILKAGAIFYHDPDDNFYGSAANGCLKNCWTPDGDCCSGRLCGGTVILHYDYVNTDWFEKIERCPSELLTALKPGYYTMEVHADDTWTIQKYGSKPW